MRTSDWSADVCSSDLGKRIAEVYAANGGKVVIADLKIDAAEVAAREIRDAAGDALAVAMDVTDEQQVDDGVAKTIAHYGRVDVLVSNAGIQIGNSVPAFTLGARKEWLANQSHCTLLERTNDEEGSKV